MEDTIADIPRGNKSKVRLVVNNTQNVMHKSTSERITRNFFFCFMIVGYGTVISQRLSELPSLLSAKCTYEQLVNEMECIVMRDGFMEETSELNWNHNQHHQMCM